MTRQKINKKISSFYYHIRDICFWLLQSFYFVYQKEQNSGGLKAFAQSFFFYFRQNHMLKGVDFISKKKYKQ